MAEIRHGTDAVLQVEAAAPGLLAQLPARAPVPAQVQAGALAPPLHPATLGAPAHPGAPALAACLAPSALPYTGNTTGGAPAPNPNYLKRDEKEEKAEPFT